MSYSLDDLLYLMQRLRKPETGCPWDIAQDYRSITPSTLEEVYEVVDAIERADYHHLQEELGDLLFQIVFYAQIASEEARFDFKDLIATLTAKLLRRHPHVFPDGSLESERSCGNEHAEEAARIAERWEQLKQQERDEKGLQGVLADVPKALPALQRAQKLQKRVAKAGMDFRSGAEALAALKSELREVEYELAQPELDKNALQEEFGDLLFSMVNVARKFQLDANLSLRAANAKFEQRIAALEASLAAQQRTMAECSDEELDDLWQQAKALLRKSL